MKIVVTGAGDLASQKVVQRLMELGASVLLVGQNTALLKTMHPNCQAITWPEFRSVGPGYELLLHLGIGSGRSSGHSDETEMTADVAVKTSLLAREAGIRHLIYASSIDILYTANKSPETAAHRAVVDALAQVPGIDVTYLFIPSILLHSPGGVLGTLASAFRASVGIEQVAETIMDISRGSAPAGSSLVLSNGQVANRLFGIAKRTIDLAFAVTILALLWWAMILVWVGVRLQSPGPGIFRQQRVGKGEQVFSCYKFRTMHVSTPNLGTHEVPSSAVTPLGKFLRRSKLDELPQVFNILFNQMSLVGPRPCLPSQLELIEQRRSRGVFKVKPGITGLAQINSVDMSDPVRLADLDSRYLDLQSLQLDLQIILATARGSGSGDRIR